MTKVIGRPTRLTLLLIAIIAALILAGCGGSSSSGGGWSAAQKQKLENVIGGELHAAAGKLDGPLKADLNAVKECVVNELTTHFSPTSANSGAVNKALKGACGNEEKKAEAAITAAANKAAQKLTTGTTGN